LRSTLAISAAGWLAACTVGPDFTRPAAPDVDGYTPEKLAYQTASTGTGDGAPQRFVTEVDIPGQWWTLFRSPELNSLIEASLKQNADLQAAQAALKAAYENVYAQTGAYFPDVTGSFYGSRNKTATGALSPASASGNPYYTLWSPQLAISYTPDVFGLDRRTLESEQALADQQRFQLEATYLTLTSNVVAGAILEASLRGQIAATEQAIHTQRDLLGILRKQFDLGQIAMADVVTQEAALAQSEQSLPPLQKQLAQQRDLLTALAGRFPSQEIAETFTLDALKLPQDLPLSVPSKLVEQRPDVRMAEENMHSASALVGVAVANRLPQFPITGNIGSAANRLSNLFSPATGFWTIMAGITAPLFDGGALLHKERAARATLEQAAAQYRSTVISALQNVADSLRALQADADALTAAVAAERAASRSLEITRRQLQLGAISYPQVLNAEQLYAQALVTLVQARAARFADTGALFQALGGGWWNREDPAPPPTGSGPFGDLAIK
jgi:NodT family efflux transporter outer membrane factor (OMF) lipoprotein